MASNFNTNKYKETFEKRFGSGSYESGLSKAREIGKSKVQADFEKAEYNRRVSEAKKAYEKEKKEQEKKQKKIDEDKEMYDLLEETKKANESKKDKSSLLPKKITKPIKNLLSDFTNITKRVTQAVNPFDDVGFGDAMLKNAMEFDKEKSKTFDAVDRFSGRATNSASLGILGNIDKKMRNGETPDYLTKRKVGEGGGTDILSDLLGYAVPGAGIAKGLRGTALGAKGTKDLLSKEITKASAKKIAAQTAKEGAAVGGIMAGTEIAGREALNPDDYNWKQNLGQFGLEVGAGAVLDPAITLGAAKLLSKVKKPPINQKPMDDFDDIAEGPTPFDMDEPSTQVMNQTAATTQKSRPDLNTLKRAYNGEDVGEPWNNNFAKQSEKISPMNRMESSPDMPKNPYQSVLDSPLRKVEDGKPVKINRNQAYNDLADNAIANSDLWKDKGKILYGRETLERNFEDIAGKADGQFLKENYVQPVRQKETERIRFVNKQRETVESFGIKARSKEDQLTQMYGEGKINLDNLKRETPNWEKVVKTAEWYRKNYDQLISTANKALDAAGEKTIPIRENYFPHYKGVDELFETLKKFGIDIENHTLPTGINGLTENYKPNKKWFSHSQARKSDETTFGAIEGFDRYIEGISQLIYHTDNIKKMRALERSLRSKHGESTHLTNLPAYLKEQGNLLAGKKAAADRFVEENFGRRAYSVLDTIKQRTGLNMLGYNVGSATTAFIPLTHAAATTSKTAFAKGMMDTISNIVRKDGFADKSGFLTRRIGTKPLVRTKWNKIENNSMAMMDLVDRFSSQTIVRGKYYELLEKGIPEEEALKQADDWAGRIMADRSKGQQPTLFASRTLGPIMQFQIEVNNQLSFLLKDIPKNAENKKQLVSQLTQAVVFGYLANEVYEQVLGRRPSFDPIGVFMESYRNFSNEEMDNKEALGRTVKGVGNQLPFTSTFTGGRYPISAAIPSRNIDDYATGKTTVSKELMKPLKYLVAPAGGGQAFKTFEGNKILNEEGVYSENGNLRYPVENNTENVLKGLFLGKSSLPETKEYYDKPFNQRRALGEKQTAKYEEARARGLGKEFYDMAILNRTQNAEKNKMDQARKDIENIKNDETLSDKERKKKIQDVLDLLELK